MEPIMASISHDLVHGTTLDADLRPAEEARKLVKQAGFKYRSGSIWRWRPPSTEGRWLASVEEAELLSVARLLRPHGVLTTVSIETPETLAAAHESTMAMATGPASVLDDSPPTPHSLDLSAVRRPWAAPGVPPNAWRGSRWEEVAGEPPESIVSRIREDISTAYRSGLLRLPTGAKIQPWPTIHAAGWRLTILLKRWSTPYRFPFAVPIEGLGETEYTADAREALLVLRAVADQYNFNADDAAVGRFERGFSFEVIFDHLTCCSELAPTPAARLQPSTMELELA